MSTSTTKQHPAGVLAHGLHALAGHIAEHRLPLISIDASPGSDRPLKVLVAPHQVRAWLDTVDVTSEDHQPYSNGSGRRSVHVHRTCRLADSGVIIDLASVEPAALVSVPGGAA